MLLFYCLRDEEATTSVHHAVLGRRTGRGCNLSHASPSSSVKSWAALRRTTPSAGEGQQKRPASSLLLYRHKP